MAQRAAMATCSKERSGSAIGAAARGHGIPCTSLSSAISAWDAGCQFASGGIDACTAAREGGRCGSASTGQGRQWCCCRGSRSKWRSRERSVDEVGKGCKIHAAGCERRPPAGATCSLHILTLDLRRRDDASTHKLTRTNTRDLEATQEEKELIGRSHAAGVLHALLGGRLDDGHQQLLDMLH